MAFTNVVELEIKKIINFLTMPHVNLKGKNSFTD